MSTRLPFWLNTAIDPNEISTSSLNVSSSCFGGMLTVEFSRGFSLRSIAWAPAGAAAITTIVTASASAAKSIASRWRLRKRTTVVVPHSFESVRRGPLAGRSGACGS